jgi:pyridoxal phosphate enzyme (YggS family)
MQSRIAEAAASAGRSNEDITLIVVTKFHPETLVRDLYDLGVRDMGENRHQEASGKSSACADLDLRWHFIGQLQSNKARAALEYADVIHSVDRASLVSALDKAWSEKVSVEPATAPIECFIQLNLTQDPARGGVAPENLESFTETILGSPAFNLQGVMAVAPLDEEPARAFERVRAASLVVQGLEPRARFMSAGMSHDFVEAINAGATHLRIGTAITGNRPV